MLTLLNKLTKNFMKKEKYLSTSEAAKILGLSRVSVFKKIKKGEIPAERVGRNYIIPREKISPALDKEITSKEKKFINKATNRVVKEYKETLKLLGKE